MLLGVLRLTAPLPLAVSPPEPVELALSVMVPPLGVCRTPSAVPNASVPPPVIVSVVPLVTKIAPLVMVKVTPALIVNVGLLVPEMVNELIVCVAFTVSVAADRLTLAPAAAPLTVA